jgi:DNA-binding transcriptional LysR family regulator
MSDKPEINISTEMIRTIVTIADAGSFTKAAQNLHLSQPAISAQVKKLQRLIGGSLFEHNSNGVVFTPLGKEILVHCRQILRLNDQILSLMGTRLTKNTVRFGMSYYYSDAYLSASVRQGALKDVSAQIGHSDDIRRLLLQDYLDAACILLGGDDAEDWNIIDEWQEDLIWIRSHNFVLSPGRPVPLVAKAGAASEGSIIKALAQSSLGYEIVFVCSEMQTRLAAVAHGVGLMCVPRRFVNGPVVEAKEYYLPAIAPIRAALCTKSNVEPGLLRELLSRVKPHAE